MTHTKTFPTTKRAAMYHYARSCRNRDKRAYAEAFTRYLLGETDIEPDRGALSYMGAQAVRLTLRDLVR